MALRVLCMHVCVCVCIYMNICFIYLLNNFVIHWCDVCMRLFVSCTESAMLEHIHTYIHIYTSVKHAYINKKLKLFIHICMFNTCVYMYVCMYVLWALLYVCMYVCMYVLWTRVYDCTCRQIIMKEYVCMCVCVCMYVLWTLVYAFYFTGKQVWRGMYVYMCVCMYVCMYVCMCSEHLCMFVLAGK